MNLMLMLLVSSMDDPTAEPAGGGVSVQAGDPDPGYRFGSDDGLGSDEHLICLAQADPRVFGPLYERYHDRIYRYCYTRLGNKDAAEDVTAETFLKGLANLGRLRPGSVLLAWLYTLARHAVADYYHKERRTQPWPDTDDGPKTPWREAPWNEAPAGQGPAAAGQLALDRIALAQAMAQLPDVQRAVVELQLAGWTNAESAAALGKTEAAVKMTRYRAIERLQQLLAAD